MSAAVPHRLVGRPRRAAILPGRPRALVYALSLAVYCTSWTYYGSVGLASAHGLDFLPIYIGPILVVGFGRRCRRIADLARAQNLTTVADFVSARYGKSQTVAALAALDRPDRLGALYRAAAEGDHADDDDGARLVRAGPAGPGAPSSAFFLAVALLLATFAMAFGTRRIDPTEHQDGLILAIAVESLVKLVAFLGGRRLRRLGPVRRLRRSDAARRGIRASLRSFSRRPTRQSGS